MGDGNLLEELWLALKELLDLLLDHLVRYIHIRYRFVTYTYIT